MTRQTSHRTTFPLPLAVARSNPADEVRTLLHIHVGHTTNLSELPLPCNHCANVSRRLHPVLADRTTRYGTVLLDSSNRNHDNDTCIAILDTMAIPELQMKRRSKVTMPLTSPHPIACMLCVQCVLCVGIIVHCIVHK